MKCFFDNVFHKMQQSDLRICFILQNGIDKWVEVNQNFTFIIKYLFYN